jgi:predicted Zn-dependent protease
MQFPVAFFVPHDNPANLTKIAPLIPATTAFPWFPRQLKQLAFVALAFSLLIGCASQPQSIATWEIEHTLQTNTEFAKFSNSRGETVATLETAKVRRLIGIKEKIASASGRHAELLLMGGDEANALSTYMEGRPVVAINIAMIDLLDGDNDAYAAVLGHEFAHLALGHGEIRTQREEKRSIAATILGNILGLSGVPLGGTIADLTTTAVSTIYSRDEERDADRQGVAFMKIAGFDPRGAARAWEKIGNAANQSDSLLSTHPSSVERLENMKRLAQ